MCEGTHLTNMSSAQGSHKVLDTHAVEMQIESFLDNFKKNYAEWETTAHQHDTNSREVKHRVCFLFCHDFTSLTFKILQFGQICFEFVKSINQFDASIT